MPRLSLPFAFLLLAFVAAGCSESPTGDVDEAAPLSAEAQDALAALPTEAQFLAAADAQALAASGMFAGPSGSATGEMGARLRDFFEATGFDPARDVRMVYLARPALAPDPSDASRGDAPQVVVSADFDRARFQQQLADGAFSARFDQTTHRGVPLYESTETEDAGTLSFALTDGGLLLVADAPERVRQMVDRLADVGTPSVADDEDLMRLADRVRGQGNTWFAARGLQLGPGFAAADSSGQIASGLGQAARIIRSTAGALSISGETADGRLLLYTQDGASPSDLQEVLEGAVSGLSSGQNLSASRRRMLESIEIEQAPDRGVRVSFVVPLGDA